jgi:hypothetical protein
VLEIRLSTSEREHLVSVAGCLGYDVLGITDKKEIILE